MFASSQPEGAKEVSIGRHRVVFAPPDVMRVWWVGEATLADIRALFELSDRWIDRDLPYFVLADQSRMTNADQDARRAAASDPRTSRMAGLAIIGASFQLRVLMTMMNKALAVLSRGTSGPMVFVANEEEAFAWFDAERKRRGLG